MGGKVCWRQRHPAKVDLKPCPFCGEDGTRNEAGFKPELVLVETTQKGQPHTTEFGVECYRCGARTADYLKIEQAVERWNMRPL